MVRYSIRPEQSQRKRKFLKKNLALPYIQSTSINVQAVWITRFFINNADYLGEGQLQKMSGKLHYRADLLSDL